MRSVISNGFSNLKENKLLFMLCIFLQLIFFIGVSIALFNYSQSIIEPLQNINDQIMSQKWMQEMPTEENLRDLGIPGTDVAAIEAEKKKMTDATMKLYASIVALFMVTMGFAWALSYRMVSRHPWKETRVDFGKIVVVSFFALSVFFILIHSTIILLTKQFFTPNADQTYLFMLPLFLAALVLYFIPIACAIAGTAPLREILQKTIRIGVRKCLFLFSFYGVYVVTIVGLAIALVRSVEVSFLLSILLGLVLLAVVAFSRVVLIQGLHEKN